MVVPLEAEHDPASGVGAGQPDRGADGLAAGVGEPHHLDAGHRVDHLLGGLDLQLVGQPEAGSEVADRVTDRLGDDRVPVSEDHRPEAEQVVDVLRAVHVPQPGAAALGHERGVGLPAELHGARTAARAARDDLSGPVEELL